MMERCWTRSILSENKSREGRMFVKSWIFRSSAGTVDSGKQDVCLHHFVYSYLSRIGALCMLLVFVI